MKLRRLALWTVLALTAAAGGTGFYLWKQSRGGDGTFDGKAAALPIDLSQMKVQKRANSLVVWVNIFPYVPLLEGKSRAEAKAILTETAREIGARWLSEEEYRGVPTASITFKSITSKDEYGGEKMSSTRQYGT